MRYTQPQSGPAPVDTSHPLAKGLALAVNPGTSPFRDMAGRTAVRNGISVAPGPRGIGYVAAGNASLGAQFATSPMRTSDGAYGGDFTYLVIANPIASTTREFFVCNQSGIEEFYFGANFNVGLTATSGAVNAQTNNGGATGITVSGAADGNPHVYAYTRGGTGGSLYVDGVLGGTATVSQVPIGRSTSSDYIAGYSGAGWGISKGVFLVLGWNRALSAAEVKSISANPWQLFRSPQRVILASGAGPVNATGTLASTLGDATIAASGAVLNAGAFASTLGNATMAAAGSVGTAPSGTMASTLANATMSAAGAATNAGTFATSLAGASMSAAGIVINRGTFSATMGDATMAAAGTVAPNATGTFSSTLDGATMTAYGYNGVPPVLAGFFHRLPKNPRHVQRIP